MTNSNDKIMNGLQTFFAKKYTKEVASDYLKTGKLFIHPHGIDFILKLRTYHFDSSLNFLQVSDWF